MNLTRLLVIGNSGSGKSWLAAAIAARVGGRWVDLDTIHWLADDYAVARERTIALEMLAQQAAQDVWVIEGIYGWMVEAVQSRATALIWLAMDEEECVGNICQRGARGRASDQAFASLLNWARTYRSRQGSSSYTAHQLLYDGFKGDKLILSSRSAVDEFIATLA